MHFVKQCCVKKIIKIFFVGLQCCKILFCLVLYFYSIPDLTLHYSVLNLESGVYLIILQNIGLDLESGVYLMILYEEIKFSILNTI